MSRRSHKIAITPVKNLISNTIKVRFSSKGLWMRMMLVTVAGIAAALLMTIGGSAATPSSGAVSLASPSLTYTSGPFLVSNSSGRQGWCVNAPLPLR